MKREYHTPLEEARRGQSYNLSGDRDASDPDDIERRLKFYMRNSRIDDRQIIEGIHDFTPQLEDDDSHSLIDQRWVPDRRCDRD